ncbi:beta-1,3-glucanase family protein [Aquimarina sp. 2-A2]|uniref:beta-1,3-glucanase family protein n=1 Tax=Aquimarina sp. 2-A2 TaxID=3382644 RepID=UPI00387F17F0
MKTRQIIINKRTSTHILFGIVFFLISIARSQTLPYQITNDSEYTDDEIYVAIVGITDGHVWVDPVTGQVNRMDPSYNTVQGPVINGNQGPGENGLYANCFRKLSDIPNKTLQIPQIAGCRIMISFKSQLFLYFFGHSGDPSGYAAPNLENPTDPNQGIKFELVELTYNNNGLWCNTSRVDSYQYPMGLEVWGENFYKKVGELKKHNEILTKWQTSSPNEFKSLLDINQGIIKFPTKVETFPKNFLDEYIQNIWSKYVSQELAFTSDAGIWRGSVQNDNQFVFRRDSDGQIGIIAGKPTTIEAMEGSGVMASGDRWDLVVQSQMVAAITRHAVDLNVASGVLQNFGDSSKYYQTWPYNWYSKFFHQEDISFESQTYTFAYDDVYDQSATIHTIQPNAIKITIGGLQNNSNPTPSTGPVTLYADCPFSGTSVALSEGRYTRAQLEALGMVNDHVSSLKVQSGYQATLYWDDNFSGSSLIKTSDTSCLTNDTNWNDKMTSIVVSKIPTGEASLFIEAENYTNMSGVQKENCSEGGQNVGYIDAADWMVYDAIEFSSSGNYTIEYRVASAVNGGVLSTDVNAGTTVLGEVTIPNTGGWQNWTTVSHTITINAGTYSLGLYAVAGGWNINWIKITKQNANRTSVSTLDAKASDNIETTLVYPNPFKNSIQLKFEDRPKAIRILNILGYEVWKSTNIVPEEAIDLSTLKNGQYIMIIKYGDHKEIKYLIKK